MGNPRQNQIRTRVQFVVVCLDSLGPAQRANTKRGYKAKKTSREGRDWNGMEEIGMGRSFPL